MKVYVVTEAVSGEGRYDYIPEPYVLGVFESYEDAHNLFVEHIAGFDGNCEALDILVDDDMATLTETEEDWCRVIKIEETELTTAKL